MRKVTVKLKLNAFVKRAYGKLYDSVEKLELVELIKLDYSKGFKMGIAKLHLKKGLTIDDVKLPKNSRIVDLFHSEGNVHTVLVSSTIRKQYKFLLQNFKFDVIYDTPAYGTKDEIKFTIIGDENNIKIMLRAMRLMGKVESVSYVPVSYKGKGLLNLLTTKQREVYTLALDSGYYEYPRKVDASEVGKLVGCSKSTVIEHLRKIENKIMANVV